MSGGGEAAAGGRCNNLFEVMPELEAINPQLFPEGDKRRVQFQPIFKALNALKLQYAEVLSGGPSMTAVAKAELLDGLITEEVKNAAYTILQELFDGRQVEGVTKPNMASMLKCILDGLIDDLDILRLIQMVAKITISVYYGESWCRIGLAAAFVGSTLYLSWNTGISQVFSLGENGCMFVLSALSGCYQFIHDPAAFMSAFVPLLGAAIPDHIAGFVEVLKTNVNNPAVFATLIAQSNVALMGRIYGADGFQPYADLRKAAAAGDAKLPGDAAGPDAAAADADAAAAAAAAPGGPSDLCARMYTELGKGAAQSKRIAIQYFLKLIDGIRKIRYVLPGQLNRPEDRVYHQCCLFLTGSIHGLIGSLGDQADRAGLDLTELTTKILLDYLLPSKLRGLVAMGDEYSAKNEVYLLAHRIQSKVIDCISKPSNLQVRPDIFEQCFPIFGSELTAQNVEHLVQSSPEYVLSRYNDLLGRLLHQQQPHGDGGMEDSFGSNLAEVDPESQPPGVRDSKVFEEFNKRVHVMGDIFATKKEKDAALEWFRHNEGWFGRILTIPDRYITQTVKNALKCEMVQRFGDIASTELKRCANYFEQSVPPGRNTFNFPSIDSIWTDRVQWVLRFISSKTDEKKTPIEIIQLLQTMFGYPTPESFKDFFSLLMLRCKLSALLAPTKNTFDFFIMDDLANPEGVARLMLNVGTTGQDVNTQTSKLEKIATINVDVLSKPVEVPRVVERAATGAKTWVMSLFAKGGSACQAVEVMPQPPKSAVNANEERNKSLIAAIEVQDGMIESVMKAASGPAAAAAATDKVAKVAKVITEGANLAAEAVELVVLPGLLNELADEQDKVDDQSAQLAAAAASAVAGGGMEEGAQQVDVSIQGNDPLPSPAAAAAAPKTVKSQREPTQDELKEAQKQVDAAVAENPAADVENVRMRALLEVMVRNDRQNNVNTLRRAIIARGQGGKSRKNTKRTRRNKGRKSSKSAKKTKQRRSSRYRRSSRKGRK